MTLFAKYINFTPAKLDGKVINFRTIVTVRFK